MKKRNKKGFTLIELLAVIVILAVIALIAVPQVLKILNKARLSAAEDTVYGIVKSAETYVSNFMLKNRGAYPSEELVFNCSNDGCLLENISNYDSYELEGLEKLEFKGTKPKSAIVRIKENGSFITVTHANINGFNCRYLSGNGKTECSKEDLPTYIKVVYLDPTDLAKSCDASNINSDTGTKTGCMKWYVYSEDSTNYTMILDHNTTDRVAWNSSGDSSLGPITANAKLEIDTIDWDSSLNPRLISAQEIADIVGNTSWNVGALAPLYFDGKILSSQGTSKYAWLYDYTSNCTDYGCNIADNSGNNYWTSSLIAADHSIAWGVYFKGYLSGWSVGSTNIGLRPVITVNKLYLS